MLTSGQVTHSPGRSGYASGKLSHNRRRALVVPVWTAGGGARHRRRLCGRVDRRALGRFPGLILKNPEAT